jgi:hypothetical protein
VRYSPLTVLCVSLMLISVGQECNAESKPKAPNKHSIVWNTFAKNTLALHRKLISAVPVVEKTTIGGYARLPDFYVEHDYYDAKMHRLISQVQWEKQDPTQLHTIQVYLYDAKGRVIRDFTAAYLPGYHKSPTQTLISLHNYIGDLHAFRTFDASGDRRVERCTGSFQGQDVDMILDEDEIADGSPVMDSEAYKACFDGVPLKAGKFLIPQ